MEKEQFVVGGLVITSSGFPAVVTAGARSKIVSVECWGLEQEQGSAYREELRPASAGLWLATAAQLGHRAPFKAWNPKAKKGLTAAGLEVI